MGYNTLISRLAHTLCAGFVALVASFGPLAADDLPRRGLLGIRVSTEGAGPLVVLEIQPDGAGAEARVAPGDVITRLGGHEVGGWEAFSGVARRLAAGRPVELEVTRAGQHLTLSLVPQDRPREHLENAEVHYGDAAIGSGARVRTLTTLPASGALKREGKLPGVILIQGFPCASIETLHDGAHPYSRLIAHLADAGFATLRVEKPGVGDSEGAPCEDGGFDREIQALNAATDIFKTRDDIDPARLYAVGISMGGIQAPFLAASHRLDGIVTFGTGLQPWFDYTVTNFRRRWLLQGQDPGQIDATMRLWRRYFALLLILEKTPAEIAAAEPDLVAALRPILGEDPDRFAGRHYSFHRELDNRSILTAWAGYKGAVLSVHGEYDWVASIDDHRLVPGVVERAGGEGRFEVVPGMDHGFTVHESLEASFRNAFKGSPSDAFYEMAAGWLKDKARE